MDTGLLGEMSFTCALAEQKVRGREETINEHLVKLLAFEASSGLRDSWKRELLRKHFGLLAAIRVKPSSRRLAMQDFWEWLYADPFEGNEIGYIQALMALNADQYPRSTTPLPAVAARLAAFHRAMAERLSRGEDGADLVEAL